jgi:vacuolar-type H+-ATPase subunit H
VKTQVLSQIKDAEQSAATRLQEAETQAQKLLADARRKADKLVADEKAAADAAYQATLDQVRAEASEEAKKTAAGGTRKAATLRKNFEAGASGVAERVLKLFEERAL